MDKEDEVKDQAKFRRVVSTQYFGYLVGQIREVIEAISEPGKQQKSREAIILDRLYDWWNNIGDKISEQEAEEISKIHWARMDDRKVMIAISGEDTIATN